MDRTRQVSIAAVALLILIVSSGGHSAAANEPPVAEAGLPRYAATDPVKLDGRGSYDPDLSGPLSYAWTQVSGPPVVITGADSAIPTIGSFVQTNTVQKCEFRLTVSNDPLASSSDAVEVFIVPEFGANQTQLYTQEFDPGRPTIVYFGGGDCIVGYTGYQYGARVPFSSTEWRTRANILYFPNSYSPDAGAGRTYYKYGDMLIVYLSKVAPAYVQSVQTSGWSTGGQPAVDAGIRMNETYRDPRYAVNRVTLLDATAYCRDYTECIPRYLASRVAGEQCWVDNYVASIAEHEILDPRPSFPFFHDGVLNVEFDRYADAGIPWLTRHTLGNDWLGNSLANPTAMSFNQGIVAGAYLSVVGPGKNLQLTMAPGQQTYRFRWRQGHMEMVDEQAFPGRLPEPVTLLDWHDPGRPEDDPNGVILTCKESQNAVGYQLLSGSDPYDVAHYTIVADSSSPPAVSAAKLPSFDTWWTVKARDAYGSTIHADPVRVGEPVGVIAYWKLDEVEGNRAADGAGNHEGIVQGGARWQPVGGKKAGALAFDGVEDYVRTDLVLDPAAGPFSVVAWVKGGGPGQVILSQAGGVNWLMLAPSGAPMTELKQTGRLGKPLTSSVVITDGAWHRVGLVWDGSNRILYVDDIEVVKDTQAGLAGSAGGLYIGAGSAFAPGSFWSGLIDDVRIYDRAVKP